MAMIQYNPKLSVVTVCYNTVSTIESTILSVINQSYKNIEYIIVDGASSDGTLQVIEKHRGQIDLIISEKDTGIYNAMNKGIDNATGEYILFLNSGDVFYSPQVVDRLIKCLDGDVDVLYGSSALRINEREKVIVPDGIGQLKKHPIFRHNAAVFRLSLQRKYKFDEKMSERFGYGLDYNSILDMYNSGAKFKEIDEVIMSWENDGVSNNYKKSLIYTYRIAHKNQFVFVDWVLLVIKLLKYNIEETFRRCIGVMHK